MKSNRGAAGTMGGNVLEEKVKARALYDAIKGAGPVRVVCADGSPGNVIDALVCLAADASDSPGAHPTPPRRGGPIVVAVAHSVTMETTVRVGQRHERFTTHDRDTMRAVAAVAHPTAQVLHVATNDAPWRGPLGGIEVTVKAFLPTDLKGDTLRDLDAVNADDNVIAQAARRLTGKRDAVEVIEAIGRHHVREVDQIPYALGLRDGEDFPPRMREAIGQRFGLVPPSSLASRPYNPSRELRWNDPTCAALVAHGATEAQACEELLKALWETQRAAYQQRLECAADPTVATMPATREGFTTPRDATKPTGRWTAHHPDPAERARAEAMLNAPSLADAPPRRPGYATREDIEALGLSTHPLSPKSMAVLLEEYGIPLPHPAGSVNVISRGTYIPADDPRPRALGDHFVAGPFSNHDTLTFTAPPADLRSLHDAIGQAIETGTGHVARFNGGPVVVTRDEMLFSPTVTMDGSGGLPATVTIAADSKHLRMLREAVDEARETGKAPSREWGKGRRMAVERVGDVAKVAAPPSEAEPVRYEGNQGGAQAWRWEVEE